MQRCVRPCPIPMSRAAAHVRLKHTERVARRAWMTRARVRWQAAAERPHKGLGRKVALAAATFSSTSFSVLRRAHAARLCVPRAAARRSSCAPVLRGAGPCCGRPLQGSRRDLRVVCCLMRSRPLSPHPPNRALSAATGASWTPLTSTSRCSMASHTTAGPAEAAAAASAASGRGWSGLPRANMRVTRVPKGAILRVCRCVAAG